MNKKFDTQEIIVSKLDGLMRIAQEIERSSRPLPQTEATK